MDCTQKNSQDAIFTCGMWKTLCLFRLTLKKIHRIDSISLSLSLDITRAHSFRPGSHFLFIKDRKGTQDRSPCFHFTFAFELAGQRSLGRLAYSFRLSSSFSLAAAFGII